MPIFEYLIIVSHYTTNWSRIRNLPEGDRPEQTFDRVLYIWRPGAAEAEERKDENILVLLNELGAEGWKMVESRVVDSVAFTPSGPEGYYGWTLDVGIPINSRWTFMREVLS